MIAASALHAECDTLWSEDMHDGAVIQDRLRIANPFRPGRGPWPGPLITPEDAVQSRAPPIHLPLAGLAPPRSLPPPTPV